MDNQITEKLLKDLAEVNEKIGEKQAKELKLKRLERIIKRLESFSGNCEDCRKYLMELNQHLENLMNKHGNIEKMDVKEHHRLENVIISHLQKTHKLVLEGYYMSLYMSIGMSVGLLFGIVFFENVGLGMPSGLSFGLAIGVAIGVSMDADAKKKGRTI
jgi:seryl-tRNA synthetase